MSHVLDWEQTCGATGLKQAVIVEIKVALNVIMKWAVLSGATCLFAFNMQASIECINATIWGINECFKSGNKFIKIGITA